MQAVKNISIFILLLDFLFCEIFLFILVLSSQIAFKFHNNYPLSIVDLIYFYYLAIVSSPSSRVVVINQNNREWLRSLLWISLLASNSRNSLLLVKRAISGICIVQRVHESLLYTQEHQRGFVWLPSRSREVGSISRQGMSHWLLMSVLQVSPGFSPAVPFTWNALHIHSSHVLQISTNTLPPWRSLWSSSRKLPFFH